MIVGRIVTRRVASADAIALLWLAHAEVGQS